MVSTPVQQTGIGRRGGDVVISLAVPLTDMVALGSKFGVFNTATSEKWGEIEVVEISDTSCVCSVFDRINVQFWADLEMRMDTDPSPPAGITIKREVPEAELIAGLRELLVDWRG